MVIEPRVGVTLDGRKGYRSRPSVSRIGLLRLVTACETWLNTIHLSFEDSIGEYRQSVPHFLARVPKLLSCQVKREMEAL